jgi:hypothetical protein
MSRYGQLWQRVQDIRMDLGKMMPNGGRAWNTLGDAKKRASTIEALLKQWEELEAEMSKEPSDG